MENKTYKNIEFETGIKKVNQIAAIDLSIEEELFKTPEEKSLGQKIREARKAKGLTQKQLAELLHIKQSSVASLEAGQSKPNSHTKKLLIENLSIAFNQSDFQADYQLSIGEILRNTRVSYAMTQQELAEKTFLTQKTISFIEKNELVPNKSTLVLIAQNLHLDPQILIEKINKKILSVLN